MFRCKTVCACLVGLALSTAPASGQAQSRDRTGTANADWMKADSVKSAMDRLAKHADDFEDKFEMALDKSSYDGRHVEDRLLRWADMLEDELEDMAESYQSNNSTRYISHFENAMIVASAINRTMLRKDFAANAEGDWRMLRDDLNHIAMQLRRPVLPNITVIQIAPVAVTTLDKAEVKQALEQLEASTDRFQEKLQKSLRGSTANMTDQQRHWNRWARYLEDTSDDMLDEFKEKDAKDFQRELEQTLLVAEAINRMMLRSDLYPDAELEWRNVRSQLNAVAAPFGYPVITNLISVPPSQASR
jgi:hypothetical protein